MMLTSVFIAALLMLVSVAAGVTAAPPVIGLPNCDTTCGNVRVPYPFGIGPAHCSMPGFNLTCDRSRRRGAPQLLLGGDRGTSLQVVGISLVNTTVSVISQDQAINMSSSGNKQQVRRRGLRLGDGGPYVLAGMVGSKVNEFILTGCNVEATLLGPNGEPVSVCSSSCASSLTFGPNDTVCSNNGCCQASITMDYASYDVRLRRLDDRDDVGVYDRLPVHALIAEVGWFGQELAQDLTKFAEHSSPEQAEPEQLAVPVILNWAVKHGTAARRHLIPTRGHAPPTPPARSARAATACAGTRAIIRTRATRASARMATRATLTSPADAKISKSASSQKNMGASASVRNWSDRSSAGARKDTTATTPYLVAV